jgi:hypothetical protein
LESEVQAPLCKRAAIHFKVIGVSRRRRQAMATFWGLAGFPQRFQEAPPVAVVGKDGLAAVSAIQDVVKGTRVLQSQLARHAPPSPPAPRYVNSFDRPLFDPIEVETVRTVHALTGDPFREPPIVSS